LVRVWVIPGAIILAALCIMMRNETECAHRFFPVKRKKR
jgi:hypothetical protein